MAIDFISMSGDERLSWLKSLGQPQFRVKQIEEWVYGRSVISYDEMTNLPKDLRELLTASGIPVVAASIITQQRSNGATKLAVELCDGNVIESVLMQYHHGLTLCVSSQVGCKMGCSFCATAQGGFRRNLTGAEMIAQLLLANSHMRDCGQKVTHVVLMGMGEPLDNYEETLGFVRSAISPLFGLSARRITVSTCGLVPEIERLAHEGLPLTLSVSLHAPNDELRERLMPVGRAYSINKLLEAMHFYAHKTGRRVTIEYTLIKGVNDRDKHAEELVQKIKGGDFHVNLIPVNPVAGSTIERPSLPRVRKFQQVLAAAGINTTIRRELGTDVFGSCGQLRGSLRD